MYSISANNLFIQRIQNELYQLDCLVEQHNNEYKKLLNYMHQEYPIKELIISGLERDIAELKMANEKEQKAVEQLLACEIMKYKQQWNKDENDLTKAICEENICGVCTNAIPAMLSCRSGFQTMIKEDI
ncbi:Hypothetical predicted protein [Octopus vulgaris]|uniref:Uncharacterized protein n=1 Tax=Octopus vulgaris TaxID=6645 RepID=A0AA36EWQ5_OCTVU|nr:Hypothetical predicted protein [Octopus vulgaris]